jgi:hypothetical protein
VLEPCFGRWQGSVRLQRDRPNDFVADSPSAVIPDTTDLKPPWNQSAETPDAGRPEKLRLSAVGRRLTQPPLHRPPEISFLRPEGRTRSSGSRVRQANTRHMYAEPPVGWAPETGPV